MTPLYWDNHEWWRLQFTNGGPCRIEGGRWKLDPIIRDARRRAARALRVARRARLTRNDCIAAARRAAGKE